MPCSKVSINKNYKCNQANCICISTDGRPCICVCENKNGDILRCENCKCSTDDCLCKCDDSKCTCIVTNGADCVCFCRDDKGNIKICDCSCTDLDVQLSCCGKEHPITKGNAEMTERTFSGINCKCDKNGEFQILNQDAAIEKQKCKQDGCISIPINEKPCICLREYEDGELKQCDDCKCSTDNKLCKCDNLKCTCKCICREETNAKLCDYSCANLDVTKPGCKKERLTINCCKSCSNTMEHNSSKNQCKGDEKRTYQIKACNAAVENQKCMQVEYICIPTVGKHCICLSEYKNSDIIRCDDCKCSTNNSLCKCCGLKCTCIDTQGTDGICMMKERPTVNCCKCCSNTSEEGPSKIKPKNDEKGNLLLCCSAITKNIRCDCVGNASIPTDGKSCFCISTNTNSDNKRCGGCAHSADNSLCKCNDSKYSCIGCNRADCVCDYDMDRKTINPCNCVCTNSEGRNSFSKNQDSVKCCMENLEEKSANL